MEDCIHDFQLQNTRYGVTTWCSKCKATPLEVAEETMHGDSRIIQEMIRSYLGKPNAAVQVHPDPAVVICFAARATYKKRKNSKKYTVIDFIIYDKANPGSIEEFEEGNGFKTWPPRSRY